MIIRVAPSFRMSPLQSKKLTQIRLNIDIFGLTLTRLALPLSAAFPGWLQVTISIYNIMALVTILTLDPTRLPEAATTRLQQRQAWLKAVSTLPLIAVFVGAIAWAYQIPVRDLVFPPIGAIMSVYLDELLFRNIIQPKLRTIGLSKYTAILTQSLLYSAVFVLSSSPNAVVFIGFILGVFNGWIVYQYRSLWPAFVISFALHMIYLGF